MVVGRWFIGPHAVRRYIERVNRRLTYEEALAELIKASHAAHFVKVVHTTPVPIEFWRGARPLRLRFFVANSGEAGKLPVLMTVQKS